MKKILLILFLLPMCLWGQYIDFLQPPVPPSTIVLNITPDIGFKNSLTWNQIGSFDLQGAFYSDYSDAVTLYSGTSTSYTDTDAAITGYKYYRIRVDAGGWFYGSLNRTISDSTTGTIVNFVGDSNTAGVGASPQSLGFAKYFYAVKNWTAPSTGDVIGLGGYVITTESAPPYNLWVYSSGANQMNAKSDNRAFIINAYGINDAAADASATSAEYQAAQEDWIDYAVSVGWPLSRIIILGPLLNPTNTTKGTSFKNAASTASTNKGAAFLSVLDFQVANSLTPPDNLHPNTAQHRLIDLWLCKHIGNTGVVPVAPSISSITVTSPTNIRVVFNTPVIATNVGWSFKKNGVDNSPTSVSGSHSTTLDFTVPSVSSGDTVTYSYTQAGGDTFGVQHLYSLELITATDQSVTNSL